MYHVRLMGFHELETRSFFTIGTLAVDCEYDDVTEFAEVCARQLEDVVWILVRAHDCDGIAVDVCDEHGDVVLSWELIPGRPLVVYAGDECHE